ncbi:hypothetical protein [Streptomyces roseoverticillatus]|nr:hypothetical protein [Streptomyces roseoverticillatus]
MWHLVVADVQELPLPIQDGGVGLAAHRRTVHTSAGDPRMPITIRLDF